MMVLFIAVDVTVTALAWVLAYVVRFHADAVHLFIPVTKGIPDLSRYLLLIPFMAVVWPAVLYFHGLYQVKRGRSRIDEFFAILFSVLIGTALTLGATLYVRVYYRYQPDVAPSWEYSQAVFALFVVLDVLFLNAGRGAIRAWLQRQWAAGYNVTRVLVAGTGELGRTVAEALLAHRELGYRVERLPRRLARRLGARGGARGRDPRRGAPGPRAARGGPALRRPSPRGPRPHRAPRAQPQQRVRRHQGRPRRRAVRDDQGRPGGPRRHPDHQPQRGAAAGLEQHGEAAHGRDLLRVAARRAHRRSRLPDHRRCSSSSSVARGRSSSVRSA